MGRDEKNFGPKLNATTSTLPGPLSPGPLDPGPGTMYPLNPPLVGPVHIELSDDGFHYAASSTRFNVKKCYFSYLT